MVSLNLLVVSLNLHMFSLNQYIVSLNLRVVSLNLLVDAGSWRDHKVSVDQSAGADQLVLPLIPHPDNGDHPAVHHRARHLPTLQHIRQQARQAQYKMLHWYVWARCNKKKTSVRSRFSFGGSGYCFKRSSFGYTTGSATHCWIQQISELQCRFGANLGKAPSNKSEKEPKNNYSAKQNIQSLLFNS